LHNVDIFYLFLNHLALLYRDIWEKKPLLVRRHNSQHNDGWFSTKELDRILHQVRIMPPWFSR